MATAMDRAAYLDQLQQLLPPGAAWPRDPDAVLTRVLDAEAEELARVDGRAADLLEEADPRTTLELLPDWERVTGLPDQCLPAGTSLVERREAVVARLTGLGGQSVAFFMQLAAVFGYAVEIVELRPFIAGHSVCGAPLGGDHDIRHVWRVVVPDLRVVEFRAGASACGDRLGEIRRAEVLECLFQRLRPAHTRLVFQYQGA
jgi:uncharacterized protein YmfQ (DUF2313 family)